MDSMFPVHLGPAPSAQGLERQESTSTSVPSILSTTINSCGAPHSLEVQQAPVELSIVWKYINWVVLEAFSYCSLSF